MNRFQYLTKFILYILLIMNFIFARQQNLQNKPILPLEKIYKEFDSYLGFNKRSESRKSLSINLNYNGAINSGHPNIDNYAEFYASSKRTGMVSANINYTSKWLKIEIEPYFLNESGRFTHNQRLGTYSFNNNFSLRSYDESGKIDFAKANVRLNSNFLYISYGKMNHWWGPGIHNTFALSSNFPSTKSLSIGTYDDLFIGPFSFGSQILVMPYKSRNNTQLFFSGINGYLTINKSPKIKLGFNRTYLSGNFDNLQSQTHGLKNWTEKDAALLLFEPLFGSDKTGLDYTYPGSPGFDIWDELISVYTELTFSEINLDFYIEIASDDSRSNFADLRAHWDHTLGYLAGFSKVSIINRTPIIVKAEYFNTNISNSFNPIFFRGSPYKSNYFAKEEYDFFTNQGRRMSAHSGSSSDDLYFLIGFGSEKSSLYLSLSRERHGINSMENPELKNELSIMYDYKVLKRQSIRITLEHEKISNFEFIPNSYSISNLIWVSYNIQIR